MTCIGLCIMVKTCRGWYLKTVACLARVADGKSLCDEHQAIVDLWMRRQVFKEGKIPLTEDV